MRSTPSVGTDFRGAAGADIDSPCGSENIFGTCGITAKESKRRYTLGGKLFTIIERFNYVIVDTVVDVYVCFAVYCDVWVDLKLLRVQDAVSGIKLRIGRIVENVCEKLVGSFMLRIQTFMQGFNRDSKPGILRQVPKPLCGTITPIWKGIENTIAIGVEKTRINVENAVERFVKRLFRLMVGDAVIVGRKHRNTWKLIILILSSKETLRDVDCRQGLFMGY